MDFVSVSVFIWTPDFCLEKLKTVEGSGSSCWSTLYSNNKHEVQFPSCFLYRRLPDTFQRIIWHFLLHHDDLAAGVTG